MADLRVIEPEPVGDVESFLEHFRKKVATGSVSAIAVAIVYRDGTTGSGHSELSNLAAMVGSVEAMKAKMIRDMIDED